MPFDRIADAPAEIVTMRRRVEDGIALLRTICSLRFEVTSAEDANGDKDPKRVAKRKLRASQRSSTASAFSPVLDRALLLSHGVEPPTTGTEAQALTAQILEEQRESLEYCLGSLRNEPHRSFFRTAYLPAPSPEEPAVAEEGRAGVDEPAPTALTDEHGESHSAHASSLSMDLKATLYLDGIEQFGDWPIETSTRAQRDLRKARNEDGKKFKIILKKIQELSKGHFSDDNHKKLTGLNVGVPVYEAKMTRDLRLVVRPDRFHFFSPATQLPLIRIFGIYTHAQLDRRFWDAMSRMLECQGSEYKKRERTTHRRGDNVVLPARFPPLTPEQQAPTSASSSLSLSTEQTEELCILADQDVAHVFNVSQREKEIIEHRGSCIVRGMNACETESQSIDSLCCTGRSGTGPRQLFVTQSRVLAEKVEEYYGKLQQSLTTANCSYTELKEIASKGSMRRRERLVDADEEVFWRADMPKRYGALEDEHFPVFLTYDHLCRLLENEFANALSDATRQQYARETMRDFLRSRTARSQTDGVINDKTFRGTYWFHFPQKLTRRLNPDTVFSEFLGVIQGSKEAFDSVKGYLDRDAYCSRSRSSLIADTDQREAIYELFLIYRRMKTQLWQRDAADRTFELVELMKEGGLPGRPVDFLYIDEAQDNLLADTHVLRALCPNLAHGMFWAGDTAQTIAAGSAFRFSELKAFLHQATQASAIPGTRPLPSPAMFELTVNYRSHAGIVSCAAAIVELITHFWPNSVDPLPQEKGMTVGPKPTFFCNQTTTGCYQFLQDDSGSTAEFGARQCILVRNEATRDRLRSQIGAVGIILTIQESKGLEFDDVLLYNPFEDSSMDYKQWRIVLDAIPGHAAPGFDSVRHSGICRELKFLYVAITRARMNLWIVDGSRTGEPMRELLTYAGLVENHVPGTPIPRLAVTSSKEEWEEVAWSLFQKRQYSEAELAFERARLPREKRVAHAYYLRDLAQSAPVVSGTTRRGSASDTDRSTAVADAFKHAADEAIATDDKQSYSRIAGEYYVRAGDNRQAAVAFYLAGHYESAAKQYRAAGMFEEAVDVVRRHQENISVPISEGIISVARLQFLRTNEVGKACALFSSKEEALAYMADYRLESPRASLLQSLGRFSDAAECRLAEGATLEAIRLFMMDGHLPGSIMRAAQITVDELWTEYLSARRGLQVVQPQESSEHFTSGILSQLLHTVDAFQELPIEDGMHDEMAMFKALSRGDLARIRELSDRFLSANNLAASFLCLDYIFTPPFHLDSSDLLETVARLKTFLMYARTLQRFACHPDPCSSPAMQRLFSFTPLDEERYHLHHRSPLSSLVLDQSQLVQHTAGKDIPVLRHKLMKVVKDTLRQHLLDKVLGENEVCHTQLRSIRPCLLHATSGRCPIRNCPLYHAERGSDTTAAYNISVEIHILQIMVYHTLYAADIPSRILFKQQRVWLRRLYEALYPVHYKLGTLPQLSRGLIPDLQQGANIVRVWVMDFLNSLDPAEHPFRAFLNNLLRATRLAMLFDYKTAAKGLPRIPCMEPKGHRFPGLWSGPSYVVHDLVYMMQSKSSDALDRGVLFLNHILRNRLVVDIGVLCDFMDHLCSSLIVAVRLHSGATLHDLTLPKSWIVNVVNSMTDLRDKSTNRAVDYTRHLRELLLQVYTGDESEWHVLVDSFDLSKRGSYLITRSIFVARICRNICLWGYNLRSPTLRQEILQIISAIGQFDIVLSPTVSPYIYATSWDGLARAVRASTIGSNQDEMIQLWHTSVPNVDRGLPNVRRIQFTRPQDILAVLNVKDPFASEPSSLHSNSETGPLSFGPPAPSPRTGNRPHPSREDDVLLVSHDDVDEVSTAVLGQPAASAASQADKDPVDDSVVPSLSMQELAAALKISEVFKQYRRRVQAKRDVLEEMGRRIYMQFRERAQRRLLWPTLRCRLLFLGVLPQAYLEVECARNRLSAAKTDAQERLKTVEHRQLEYMQSTVDNLA
ncbi:hypothetical protein OH77DRAFT_1497420 [Trametes cingulata]|nr:hypothetical protein OH77DRAFT_1497420 [Trametes cingulata]